MQERVLYFASLKEGRDRYFVEYRPPLPGFRFATLQLVFTEPAGIDFVARVMESEADLWLGRYPVAVMVSAFDSVGDLITLAPLKDCNHLLAFTPVGTDEVNHAWRLISDADLPSHPLDPDFLLRTYRGIGFKTSEEAKREAARYIKVLRVGWSLVFVWLVVIPVAVAIAGFASVWIGGIALIYSLFQAAIRVRRLLGKKSSRDRVREAADLRMRHHHYHCERNPDGFVRLRNENFESEERDRIRREAEALRHGASS